MDRHQNHSLLWVCDSQDFPLRRCLNILDCGLQLHEVQNLPSDKYLERAKIVDSCNGLLCLEILDYEKTPHSHSLWNPATAEIIHVPRATTNASGFGTRKTGFGFSPTDNDYKIVRTYAKPDGVTHAEVFSLNQGKWNAIGVENLNNVELNPETVTANGAIYWSGIKLVSAEEEAEDDARVVVSFDVGNEKFTVIPWPEKDYIAVEKLTVYENKLAILCDILVREIEEEEDDEIPCSIDLWVLDEESPNWTKIYTSSASTLHPITILGNGIVCKSDSEGYVHKGTKDVLCVLDLTTNEVKKVFLPYHGHTHRFINHAES